MHLQTADVAQKWFLLRFLCPCVFWGGTTVSSHIVKIWTWCSGTALSVELPTNFSRAAESGISVPGELGQFLLWNELERVGLRFLDSPMDGKKNST